MADAMVASGLREKGYEYINLSEGWPMGPDKRFANGTISPERCSHSDVPLYLLYG